MPKSTNQKGKLIRLRQILLENTDNEHCLSMDEILDKLSMYGVEAERKSIYSDIEELNNLGMDIEHQRGKNGGYYVASREFELPELKLLVDTVQSAKFITAKKSNELIRKLEGLTSKYEAQELQSEVYVANRVKTMNESIYYLVDYIAEAINKNRKITFQYLEWTLDKKRVPKRNGELYKVSPRMLSWDDENYYMVAYDDNDKKTKHYRVDKMQKITVTDEPREGTDAPFDAAVYSRKIFGMFGGVEEYVTLECDNSMIGIIMDRFGQDVSLLKKDGCFEVTVSVMVSPQFLGWVLSLCGQVRIISPKRVYDELCELASKSINYSTEVKK